MAIDYNELEQALREMKPRQRLYELVKAEVSRRGFWKRKAGGVPFKKGDDPRRKPLN